MPVESEADRECFVDASEFGTRATWRASLVEGIFDQPYQLIGADVFEAGAEGSSPRFICPSARVPAGYGHGDALIIEQMQDDGSFLPIGEFKAVEFMPDGTGMTTVRLQQV